MKKSASKWVLILIVLCFVGSSKAGGIPVIDSVNVTQTTVDAIENVNQTFKQIQQYQTQLQQYENMIRNTLAPPAYIWAQAEYTMNRLINASNSIKYYKQRHGGLEGYMQRFRNVNYYRTSPCFQLGAKRSDSAWSLIRQGQNESTQAEKSAADSVLRGLNEHQNRMPLDAAHLQMLQTNAQSAEGQMSAIQYANQLAAYQSNQLLQMRALMIAQYNAENTRNQARVDQEAIWQAAREAATKRLSPVNLPPGKRWSVKDAF